MTGQFAAVDSLLTGAENLRLMGDLCHLGRDEGRRRVADLLEQFDLVDAADKPPSTYSGGMRRRLDLAMTLVGDPRIIFLDEPTTGLDPRSRHTMWEIVRELVRRGVTIFLTTQYLDEADQLADRIAVLDRGTHRRRRDAGGAEAPGAGRPHPAACRRPDRPARAATALDGAVPDEQALTVRIPSDGGITSLRAVLQRPRRRRHRRRGPVGPHAQPRRRVLRPHRPAHRQAVPA